MMRTTQHVDHKKIPMAIAVHIGHVQAHREQAGLLDPWRKCRKESAILLVDPEPIR